MSNSIIRIGAELFGQIYFQDKPGNPFYIIHKILIYKPFSLKIYIYSRIDIFIKYYIRRNEEILSIDVTKQNWDNYLQNYVEGVLPFTLMRESEKLKINNLMDLTFPAFQDDVW